MSDFTVKPLEKSTWQDFARLVEKHNGVWGGCWCLSFHQKGTGSASKNKEEKKGLVFAGEAHASLVYDDSKAIGWCQFGTTNTLPRIKHKRQYNSELTELPDWRITCFFVDRDYRGKGVASIALAGALNEIARLGGGTVESYPEDAAGRSTSGSFLYNATLAIFERQGFQRIRPLGKHHWVVRKVVELGRLV
jgi:GNAT superfamily N-acetyltransferase